MVESVKVKRFVEFDLLVCVIIIIFFVGKLFVGLLVVNVVLFYWLMVLLYILINCFMERFSLLVLKFGMLYFIIMVLKNRLVY